MQRSDAGHEVLQGSALRCATFGKKCQLETLKVQNPGGFLPCANLFTQQVG